KKSDAYNQATGDGYGVVYTYRDGHYICDEDCTARLIDEFGNECGIYPNEELNRRQWFKQSECKTIIISDSCGLSFYGDVKIYVTYDLNGFIDTYRVTDPDDGLYEGEVIVNFEDLPEEDPYFEVKAEKFNAESNRNSNLDLYNHIAQNYAAYDLGLNSPEEMLTLLNILEAHGESLEDIANYTSHAIDNIFNSDITRIDIVQALMECNVFFDGENSDYLQDREADFLESGLASGRIIKTTNGYVEINII
ncbi:MAG: hypothetical protein ACRC36_15370, partial [Lacrimispora sphenoides]